MLKFGNLLSSHWGNYLLSSSSLFMKAEVLLWRLQRKINAFLARQMPSSIFVMVCWWLIVSLLFSLALDFQPLCEIQALLASVSTISLRTFSVVSQHNSNLWRKLVLFFPSILSSVLYFWSLQLHFKFSQMI